MTSRPPAIGGIGRGRPVNRTAQQSGPGDNRDFSESNKYEKGTGAGNYVGKATGFGSGGFGQPAGHEEAVATGFHSGLNTSGGPDTRIANSFGGGNPTSGGNRQIFGYEGFGCGSDNQSSGYGSGGFSGSDFGSSSSGFSSGQNALAGNERSSFESDRPSRGRGAGGRGRGCFKCGSLDHISRECSNPDSGGGGRSNTCYRCNGTGHLAKDCDQPAESEKPKKTASTYVPVETSVDALWQQHIPAGIHFERYAHIPVEVTGPNSDKEPIKSFSEADLPAQLLQNVQHAGYTTLTPVQQYAIPYILAKRDFMACAQTGSGKTAAFILPILTALVKSPTLLDTVPGDRQEPAVIIMAPTRELAIQIKDEARKFSTGTKAKVVPLYGGTSVWHQQRELQQGCSICVATPGRLLDFVNRGFIRLSRCKYLVLDEADRMLDMGFESMVRQLVQQSDMPPKMERQTLMFSATFPSSIQQLALEFLNEHVFITVGQVGAANMDITQELVLVNDSGEKKDLVVKFILETMNEAKDEHGIFHKKTIVFVQRKRMADYLCAELCGNDDDQKSGDAIKATCLHGDREQRERELVFQQFKCGEFPVLVATDVAARGLDIREVDHVINFDMPQDISDYVHRIGRTARVGNTGRSTSFFDPSTDTAIARDLLKVLTDAQQKPPEWLQELATNGYLRSNAGESQNDAW